MRKLQSCTFWFHWEEKNLPLVCKTQDEGGIGGEKSAEVFWSLHSSTEWEIKFMRKQKDQQIWDLEVGDHEFIVI